MNRIADALILLARATSGEFDQVEDEPDSDNKPLPPGYKGMR